MQRSAERLAFECYVRTGRRLPPTAFVTDAAPLETKFNPYHDPRNGQFTFGPGGVGARRVTSGRWRGGGFTGGGGGAFGGGGATGSWERPSSTTPRSLTRAKRPDQSDQSAIQMPAAVPLASKAQGRVIVRNGYSYQLDEADRTMSVSGTLTLASNKQRSRNAQTSAGGSDRLPTDDGGHYIAVRFNGPTDRFNHFAQDANFNRGGYRVLENGWAKNIKEGKQVYVAIKPRYAGASKAACLHRRGVHRQWKTWFREVSQSFRGEGSWQMKLAVF